MAEAALTASPRHPRRRVIVGGFQTAFLVTLLVWVAAWLTLFAFAVLAPAVWPMLDGGRQADDPAVGSALLVLHERLWWPLAGFFVGLTIVLVRETHRVAGPLYRFRQVFRRVADGDVAQGIKIRDHDYLAEEAAEFDRMIAGIRTRASGVQISIDRVVFALDALERGDSCSSPQRETLRRAVEQAREAAARFRTSGGAPPPEMAGDARDSAGFSLIELLIVVAIVATVAAIAVPTYASALTRARVARAIGDVNAIGKDISMFRVSKGCFPANLTDVGHSTLLDPWQNPYVYVVPNFAPSGSGGGRGGSGGGPPAGSCGACGGACVPIGVARKDKNLVPINFDFDLYSKGQDRLSATAITAGTSKDDIIRGRNGGFIGLASDY